MFDYEIIDDIHIINNKTIICLSYYHTIIYNICNDYYCEHYYCGNYIFIGGKVYDYSFK